MIHAPGESKAKFANLASPDKFIPNNNVLKQLNHASSKDTLVKFWLQFNTLHTPSHYLATAGLKTCMNID